MGRGREFFLVLLVFVWLLGVTTPGQSQVSQVAAASRARAAEAATATPTLRVAF